METAKCYNSEMELSIISPYKKPGCLLWNIRTNHDGEKVHHIKETYIPMGFSSNTSIEHLTSSTVGQIMRGFPMPSGDLSLETPDDMEIASSDNHFSSREPREENCNEQ